MLIKGKQRTIRTLLVGWRRERLLLALFFPGALFVVTVALVLDRPHGFARSPVDAEELFVTIKKKHLRELRAVEREAAATEGILNTTDVSEYFVPATIEHSGTLMRVRLRPKGNQIGTRNRRKMALRVDMKDGARFLGMSTFSLHDPALKSELGEWIFHRLAASLGLVTLRYDFIKVHLNGEYGGVYALEEHFGRELIERNRQREGILIRFDEYWFYYWRVLGDRTDAWRHEYSISHVDAFDTREILANPALRLQFRTAKNLLEAFRRKDLPTHKVFDAKKLAALFAITDLMGDHHAVEVRNMKFYYNPITSLLEPVGFDHHFGVRRIRKLLGYGRQIRTAGQEVEELVWEDTFFEDAEFFREYLRALRHVSSAQFLEKFLSRIGPEYDRLRRLIDTNARARSRERDFVRLRDNREFIRRQFSPLRCLDVYLSRFEASDLELEIRNFHFLPVEVTGYVLDGREFSRQEPPLIVSGKRSYRLLEGRRVELGAPVELATQPASLERLQVEYRILGAEETRRGDVHPWSAYDPDFTRDDLVRSSPNHTDFPFLVTDEARRVISATPGVHRVDRSMLIPPGFTFLVREGTTLDLTDSAMILSYSPVHFLGAAERPVTLRSSDRSGQGLAVLRAAQRSILESAEFLDLGSPSRAGWELTGAVTFYESPVGISGCRFSKSRSEDALNIVRSDFEIADTVFVDISADALDADFARGRILRTRFLGAGNDGIDVSGSEIHVEGVEITGARDKGLSAGERSRVRMRDSRVVDSEIAVASKDASEVELHRVELRGSNVALTAYQKKPEFGPGSIRSLGLTLAGNKVPYLLEAGSRIDINAEPVSANARDVKSRMYGVEYGKASE